MTNKEKQILEIIKNNPMIEQNDIADMLHIKRSTVAVHIASLQKQGLLMGKGYIINEDKYVVGIGAANVDIYGKSTIAIKTHYDHPANITTSVGGVTRNVLENVSLLGVKTKLISAIGNDVYGKLIVDHCEEVGIDVSNVLKVDGMSSGLFMQVQDNDNDMYLALCDMSVNERINLEYIKSKHKVLKNAKVIVIDPSLDNKVIEHILDTYKDIPIFMDPVSDNYALKMKPYIGKLFACKPNKTELENLSGVKISNDKDLKKAGQKLIDEGLDKLYVSLGKKGCLYMDKQGNYIKKDIKPAESVVNASGAGDSFYAAVIYSYINQFDDNKTLDYALAAGRIALESKTPINPKLSVKLINKRIKENYR